MKKAYENWMHVVEYDGKSLLGFKQPNNSDASQAEAPRVSEEYTNSFDQQFTLQNLPVPVPSDQPTMDPGLAVGGTYCSARNSLVYLSIRVKVLIQNSMSYPYAGL